MSVLFMQIVDVVLSPIRLGLRAVLLCPCHWFFTCLSIGSVALFVAKLFGTLPTGKHSFSLWELGVVVAIFTLAAVAAWVQRPRLKYTEEQLEAMRVRNMASVQDRLVRRLTADEAREMITDVLEPAQTRRQRLSRLQRLTTG